MNRPLLLLVTSLGLASSPSLLSAQLSHRSIEVFGTIGGVAGAAPVRLEAANVTGVHAGFRADAGIQGERVAMAAGARVWEFKPTDRFGGHGLDAFLQGEYRVGGGTRTTLRGTIGSGFDELDPGRGPYRDNVDQSGVNFSFGLGHEWVAPSGALVLFSADVVIPTVNHDVIGRGAPVLELGFGYRFRHIQAIGPLPVPRAPR